MESRTESAAISEGVCAVVLVAAMFTPVLADTEPAEPTFAQAAREYQAGNWPAAVASLDGFIAANPDDPRAVEALFFLAEAVTELGRYAEAATRYRDFLKNAVADSKHRRRATFRVAETLYLAADYGPAEEAVKAFIEAYPGDSLCAYAWPYLADIHATNGQYTEAIQVYSEFLQKHPQSSLVGVARFGLARAAERAGDIELARRTLRQIIEADQAHRSRALLQLALLNYSQKDFALAERELTELLGNLDAAGQAAEVFDARYWRGMSRFAQGDFVHAIKDFDLCRQLGGDQHERAETLHRYRSQAQLALRQLSAESSFESSWLERTLSAVRRDLRSGEWDAAEERLREIMSQRPKTGDLDRYWYLLAEGYENASRASRETACLETMQREFPQSPYWAEVTLRLAQRAAGHAEYARARRLLDEFFEKQHADDLVATGWYLRGRIEAHEGNWPAVSLAMQQVVRHESVGELSDKARYWTAESLFRLHQLQPAAVAFEGLVRSDSASNWRAMIPLRLAQMDARQQAWSSALTRVSSLATDYPDFRQQFEADYLKGRCHAALGEFSAARSAYRRVVNSTLAADTETAAMAQWMIGESYLHQRRYEEALHEYLRVNVLHNWPAWQAAALFQAGKCYELLEWRLPAVESYARVISRFPTSDFAAEAQTRMDNVRLALGSEPDTPRR